MVDQESCKCAAGEAPEMTAKIHTDLKPTKVQPLDAAALAELQRCIQGRLITPGHPSYEEHRKVWNGSIDRYPALVARCMSVTDVIAALSFARRTAMRVAVRGGAIASPGLESVTEAS
jgi:hypothetical protein